MGLYNSGTYEQRVNKLWLTIVYLSNDRYGLYGGSLKAVINDGYLNDGIC